MLIQSAQYVSEQGGNASNLEVHGQDSDGAVVSICKMNIILHNITNYQIEFGDTLAEPFNVQGGRLRPFDRVIANPPFSQNYKRTGIQRPERFKYGLAPETGKKADLMFVQHMLASLKRTGRGAVVMPHGVLFRGGKEREIRQGMLTDPEYGAVIEAIISLPPKLVLWHRNPGRDPGAEQKQARRAARQSLLHKRRCRVCRGQKPERAASRRHRKA